MNPCRSNRAVWATHAQELAQHIVNHLAHVYVGALLPMVGAGTDWYAWQAGAAAACSLGVLWELIPAICITSENKWRASAIGLLSFGAGAAAAAVLLLASGR